MAVKPDPPSTTASTYDSDCILDIGQVPRLGEEYDEVILYDELLSVHNALEALAECAGTDDCYCIELCDDSTGSECKEYECDSFLTALNSTASNVWPMNDATGSTAIAASKGGVNVPEYGSVLYERTSLLTDACAGSFAARDNALSGWRDSTLAQGSRVPLTLEGSTGGLVQLTGSDCRIITLGFSNQTDVALSLNHNGSNIISTISGLGPGSVLLDWTGTPTGGGNKNFIILNYTLVTNGDYSLELFIDFVSYGVKSGNLAGNTFAINANTRFSTGGAGNDSLDNQYLYFNIDRLSTTEIAFLSDAWDQNKIGYVDPEPDCGASTFPIPENNQGLIYRSAGISEVTGLEEGCWEFACIPEVCCNVPGPGYLCDSYETALIANVTAMWPMNDPTGSTTVIDVIGGNNLPVVGSVQFEQASMIDDCGGEFSIRMGVGNAVQETPSPLVTSTIGSIGTVFNTDTGLNSGGDIWIKWPDNSPGTLSASSIHIYSLSTTSIRVVLGPSANPDIFEDYNDVLNPELPATQNIALNYNLDAVGNYSIEVFVNFVSQGIRTGLSPSGEGWVLGAGTNLFAIATGGDGDYQYSWYKNAELTESDVSLFRNAWLQNQIGYVGESTGVPTEGQVLKATGEEGDNTYCAEDIYPEGAANQVLTRNSAAPDDVSWADAGTAAGGSVIFSPYDPDPVSTGTFWVTGGY